MLVLYRRFLKKRIVADADTETDHSKYQGQICPEHMGERGAGRMPYVLGKASRRGRRGSRWKFQCEQSYGGERPCGMSRNCEEPRVAGAGTVRQEAMSVEIGEGGKDFMSKSWALSCG